ncbi:unnamed protein product [Durusdinium trenchii]|uniref:Transcription factor TFIIB cyclin-like domain-containing protein n=1 Tax=Durusdinium trenchii TaxID=1381693 RepID=A0ABP0RKJ7_9DINO
MPPTCSECGSTDVEVQRGVHTCCACGAALENLGCELLRGNLHKKLEVKRHDHHLMRLKQINRNAVLMQVRQQKWRAALGKLCGILRLQPAIQDAALRLVQHTCSRGFRGSKERHKLLGCACLLVAASKHNIGVTLEEVANRCEVQANLLQKMVWKVCAQSGLRISRTEENAEALMMRMCNYLNVTQTGGVCAYGRKLVAVAQQGWVCTGRRWSFVVGAAFLLSAQAFFYLIDVNDVARFLGVGARTIETRVKEIKELLLSAMQHLPWGHMIDISNIHVYLPFALEHWDVLLPVAPVLRKQQIEKQQRRQKALELFGPGSLGPPSSDQLRDQSETKQ